MLTTQRLISAPLIAALALLTAPLPLTAQRAPIEAEHGMVVSVHELASQAGVEILQQGGNAVDAAVATGLALTVVYPFAGNIGGGGFMMIHLAGATPGTGRDIAIDYRETAPAGATRDMYVGQDGKLRQGAGSSTVGWQASGVPGSVAGFALAMQKYGSGKVTWAQVVEPARRLPPPSILLLSCSPRLLTRKKFTSNKAPSGKPANTGCKPISGRPWLAYKKMAPENFMRARLPKKLPPPCPPMAVISPSLI
jgi:gamma-glutamyltranspeptidase/glutathione hydrolase